jgi:hypothetical protein
MYPINAADFRWFSESGIWMRYTIALLGAWAICAGSVLAQTAEPQDKVTPVAIGLEPTLIDTTAPSACPDCCYTELDFLLRWFKPVCLTPPILTIGSPTAAIPGAINQPGTQVIVGEAHKFDFGVTPGIAATVGWQRSDRAFGFEFSGFVMEEAAAGEIFVSGRNGTPATYLPYQATDNSQQALPFTIPGVVVGSVLTIGSTKVWGVEGDLTLPFTIECAKHSCYGRVLIGCRYLDLTDRVRVSDALSLVADPSAIAIGADEFLTRNQFVGPDVGIVLGTAWNKLSLEYTTKLAAGLTHQSRIIEGSPLLSSTNSSPLLVPGPLLALPSNIGQETAWRVTLVPEIGLKLRWSPRDWCSLSLGYSLIYWNKVLCPGDQMDPHVNITQLPFHGPVTGPLAPMPLFVHTDYFAQGIDMGLRLSF